MIEYYQKFCGNIDDFGYVTKSKKIAIAVSGGSDSMALLDLSRLWAIEHNIEIVAITVNHNLRASALSEIKFVREFCQLNNIECHVLNWTENVSSNIQQKARLARYQLITSLCRQLQILHLFTGHHKDDNVENFIMRLFKGSGPIGLTKNNEYFHNNIRILRPLHNFSKDECRQYLNSFNIQWVEDESNFSNKYLRNDIRINAESMLDKMNVSYAQMIDRLSSTQDHYGDVVDIVKESFINLLAKYCHVENLGYACIDYKGIRSENGYLQNLLLSYLVTIISGKSILPRSQKVEYILSNIAQGNNNFFVLHGCRVIFEDFKIFILRELSAILKTDEQLKLKNKMIFDNRFEILFKAEFLEEENNLLISHLGEKDWLLLKDNIDFSSYFIASFKYKNHVIKSLPALKRGDKIVAIPHTNYYDIEASYLKKYDIKINFIANYFSKLVHY